MKVWKMIFLFTWVILRFHVNLPGCNSFPLKSFIFEPKKGKDRVTKIFINKSLATKFSTNPKSPQPYANTSYPMTPCFKTIFDTQADIPEILKKGNLTFREILVGL